MYYGKCWNCAVIWGVGIDYCEDYGSPFEQWVDSCNWKESAELARKIANLPLKEGVKE